MIINIKINSLSELKNKFCNKITNISLKSNWYVKVVWSE